MNDAVQIRDGGELMSGPFRLESSKYKPVFAEKRSFYGQTLAMWVAYLPDAGQRAGVVVSKRTFRRAVDRNRAKRLLREAFRLCRHRLKPGVDLILIARSGIADKKCQDVMRDFEKVCCRAHVWQRVAPGGGTHG